MPRSSKPQPVVSESPEPATSIQPLRVPTLPGIPHVPRVQTPPGDLENPQERPEGPSRTDPPPGEGTGVPGASGARSVGVCARCSGPLFCYPPDTWKERLRTIRDGAVYLAVAWICFRLKLAEKLDPGTAVFFLLLAGIRFKDVTEFMAIRAGIPRGVAGS